MRMSSVGAVSSTSDAYIHDCLNINIFNKQHFGITPQHTHAHLCKPIVTAESQTLQMSCLADIALCIITTHYPHLKFYCVLHPHKLKTITIIRCTEHIHGIRILCDIHDRLATRVTKTTVMLCTCFSHHSSQTDSPRSTAPPLVSLRILLKS